ncbi:MAG: hypothetical protein MZV63_46855 [Marinilabiliales bacterium]|nr:hypothetical protein [Marinilabiliales bacterium]
MIDDGSFLDQIRRYFHTPDFSGAVERRLSFAVCGPDQTRLFFDKGFDFGQVAGPSRVVNFGGENRRQQGRQSGENE